MTTDRGRLAVALFLVSFLVIANEASGSTVGVSALRIVRVASGFSGPTYVTAPRSELDRLYVVERAGVIRVLERGKLRAQPFLDIRSDVRSTGFEQGLLSMAFDPSYADNHRFYVDYTDRENAVRVMQFRSDGTRALAGTARELLRVPKSTPSHNGGQLQFGPDGLLYVSVGDGGGHYNPKNTAQDLGSRLGKLLRTDPAQPSWQVAGYGFRNPWRFSFDRGTGDLWIGDVGEAKREEIDWRPRGAPPANFGWPRYEGRQVVKSVKVAKGGPLVFPVFDWGHDKGCAATGGYVYRGQAVPAARGRYFFGDWCAGLVASFRLVSGKPQDLRVEPFRVPSITSFGEDARGELYLVSEKGAIFRLTS